MKSSVKNESSVVVSTPIEIHDGVFVKRDDLCCDSPQLAKMRGIWKYVSKRKSFDGFGILDGAHSRNGWALARVCRELGKSAVTYWPIKKHQRSLPIHEAQGYSRCRAEALGAVIVPIQAGRSAVVYAQARADLARRIPNSVMLPNAVKIDETVEAHIEEIKAQRDEWKEIAPESLVIGCGTGTILSGVLAGFFSIGITPTTYVVLGYSVNEERLRRYISSHTLFPQDNIKIIDLGYSYGSEASSPVPFGSCRHYEAKAWAWLQGNRELTTGSVAFWNSGD